MTVHNVNRLQLPRRPQHVPPSQQLSLEETNHYLLPVLTLPLLTYNAQSSVCTTVSVASLPASTSYLCLKQRVWQGHCCKGLVCLLDIDGDLVRRRWWRWLLLQGQKQKVKITTDVIKKTNTGETAQLSACKAWEVEYVKDSSCSFRQKHEQHIVHVIYSSTRITAPFYFLDGGGMILLVIQILTDLTRILWLISWPRGHTAVTLLEDFHPVELAHAYYQWAFGVGIGQLYSWLWPLP